MAETSTTTTGARRRAAPREKRAALSPVALAPITRETVQDRVTKELRRALIFGVFEPGQVLTILDLAARFQTSTMPVRDALSRLISEQALEALPNRSVRVPLITAERLDDLLHARLVNEGAALELAAPRLTRADMDALRASIRDYDRAIARRGRSHVEGELEANRAFHVRLYQASGSSVLMPIIDSLWLQSGPVVRAAVDAFDPDAELSAPHFHIEILDALERGDVPGARAALARDIRRAFDLLRDRIGGRREQPSGGAPA